MSPILLEIISGHKYRGVLKDCSWLTWHKLVMFMNIRILFESQWKIISFLSQNVAGIFIMPTRIPSDFLNSRSPVFTVPINVSMMRLVSLNRGMHLNFYWNHVDRWRKCCESECELIQALVFFCIWITWFSEFFHSLFLGSKTSFDRYLISTVQC